MNQTIETIRTAASYVSERLGGRTPLAGIILGSGLGKLADRIEDQTVIPYREIPGFPTTTAVGHKGNLIAGMLGGKFVIAMQGRFHYYEGYPMELVTLPVRVMKMLGVEYVFVSNAAGGVNQDFKVGDLMVIKDHICTHPNPLIGPNLEEFGPRFPDMTCPYDLDIIAKAYSVAGEMGISLREGVYLSNTGPTYETPAEVRYYRTIGADAVGMSTAPEVIVARHCGLKVFGMSVITNISNISNTVRKLNDGNDVVEMANAAADRMSELFTRLIASL